MAIPDHVSMTPCECSNVAAYGYDDADGSLYVRFEGSAVYRYDDVPVRILQRDGPSRVQRLVPQRAGKADLKTVKLRW